MSFFIIINKYDDALLEFGQKLVTFSNLEIVKEVSITEKNPHGLWLNTVSSRSVCRNADCIAILA